MFWAAKTGPETGMPYDDPGYVSGQYSDASHLGARTASRGGIRVAKDTGTFEARR